ncbi:MAG: hypothetical protein A2563_02040 [Candidatus Magasanikbacteria bacterium RIFOXYD1_FULL_40_23]|uniref:UDP-N-acetylmuramate:L-alanyl-gamma-D-glutamyl-meso-diaminopimelate ligase n=1 Tax=Candidatus Magasanikbacteria bacterium RIFOXYD1_FULL_40_23 TaxID=1798705 RepID=A0A1F6PB73_9BACT|nr:MAG: hypothetical protein A2563_02040 [Candidatus Magasanikbacteria bacterium RIFOXYD1_FULL_40_23]
MRIHFIGICGVAMSALATAFHNDSWDVTGSDVGFFPPISDYLKNNKIKFYPGWHVDKMMAGGTPNIIVVGNVAGSTNPEFAFAQENNLHYLSYPELIAEYIVQKNSIVCAGTYGKTSSTALLTQILQKANMDPSYMFGGLSINLKHSAKLKTDKNTWSVLEGDEYKTARWDNRPKFALYSPTHLLLTSASWDHADIYPTEESYFQAFRDLITAIPDDGLIVACTDAKQIKELINTKENKTRTITYSKNESADYRYYDLKQAQDGISFKIRNNDKEYAVQAPVLGEHMAENICGSFALAKEIGVDPNIILSAIAEFKGVKRRLEKRYTNDITIYDDLAHSPTKATATLSTLRTIYPNSKIVAVFEPNTGNRKSQSAPGYANAFKNADEVIIPTLTKVKVNKDDIDPPFDADALQNIISQTHPNALFIPEDKDLIEHIKKTTSKGDVVVFLGSHGFRGMIDSLITSLHPPLPR